MASESSKTKKTKQEKAIDSIMALLSLIILLYSVLILLSGTQYSGIIKVALGILAALLALVVISMIGDMGREKKLRSVFVLYAPEDLAFVSKLYNALKVAPYRVIWDKREIHVGDHIEEKRDRLLEESEDVIFVISRSSTSADSPNQDLTKALQLSKRILPVLIDDAKIPSDLSEIMYADFRTSFDDGYFSLRAALKAKHEIKVPAPPEKAAPA